MRRLYVYHRAFFEEAWNFNTGYDLSAEISCEKQEERKTLPEDLYQEAERKWNLNTSGV